jgi:hypothetical protein
MTKSACCNGCSVICDEIYDEIDTTSWCLDFISGFISSIANLWRNLSVCHGCSVICDEIRKRHGNFDMDQMISCSDMGGIYTRNNPPSLVWIWDGNEEAKHVKGSPEINSRGALAWLLTFYAASTKSVITLYWEVQWTCGLFHWKVDFKTVPWSTHAAPKLSGFKSYDQIIMKVRTCPNWCVRTCLNWLSELNLLVHPLSELIHLVLLLCFISVYSCTTPLTYIPKYNQCRTFR